MSIAFWAIPALHSQTQGYTFSTFAGITGRAGNTDGSGGTGGLPLFNSPIGLVVNKGTGNIYVADPGNALIRVVTPAGVVTTLAGIVGQSGILDGTGTAAGFNSPQGPTIDSAGNIYVADYGSATIRKITPAGVVTTFAGLAVTPGNADGSGTTARFTNPSGLAVDGADNIYVADSGNHMIRKITPAGFVSTLAGSAGLLGSADGTGTAARFHNPRGLVADSAGNVYVADTGNNTIRKITPAGVVTTLAGLTGTFGGDDGVGAAARFNFPNSLALDSNSGYIYVADEINNAIRRVAIAADGTVTVTTLAGLAGAPTTTVADRRADGTGSAARFSQPTGVAVDNAGNVYVADYGNDLIRKVTPAGSVTTIAGAGGTAGAQDGSGYSINPALFAGPATTATDAAGNVYVADTANSTIRKVTPAGLVTTLAGSPVVTGRTDGVGAAASFSGPVGVASDNAGNVYVADTSNHLIRRVAPDGTVTTLAGTGGTSGSADGTGTAASFNFPSGVAADNAGYVYVADYENNTIRKIAPGNLVTTLAGTAGSSGSADGVGAGARFNHPRNVAADNSGNVYVADTGNHTIRKITSGGLVTTLAGSAGNAGHADGTGSAATFSGPAGVAVDSAGNVYVADTTNSTIRAISPAGVVTTLGGVAGIAGNVDGTGAGAQFDHPTGVAVDLAGYLYVADNRNNTIRKGFAPGSPGNPSNPGSGTGNGSGAGTGNGSGNGTGNNTGGTGVGTGFLLHPSGLVVDNSIGILFIADTANNSIKRIATDGSVTVFAGKDGSAGSADGTGSAALFNAPTGIVVDSAGTFFVCDTGNATIRKITAGAVVTTLAGSPGARGSQDGTGSAAKFSNPTGIAMDTAGNLYVADSTNCTIRMVTTAGVVTTLAGSATSPGDADGVGPAARFNNPVGMAADASNNLYIADTYNNTIRKIVSVSNSTTTTSGTANVSGVYISGANAGFSFTVPASTATMTVTVYLGGSSAAGRLTAHLSDASAPDYVKSDTFVTGQYDRNFTITYASASASQTLTITWINTDTTGGYVTLSGAALALGGTGGPLTGTMGTDSAPVNLTTVGTSDWVHWQNATPSIYDNKVTGSNQISTFTPIGTGLVTSYSNDPRPMSWTDGATNGSHVVGTTVSTLAGSAGISGAYDGSGIFALFNLPQGLSIDGFSNLYVADTGNNCIRKITVKGAVTTIAGIAGISGSRDGPSGTALFNQPQALYISGGLTVADTGNSVLRTISAGSVGTFALKAPTTTTTTTPATTSAYGGGSVDPWLAGALLTLGGLAWQTRRRRRSL